MSILTLTDPLAGQAVTVVVTLPAHDGPHLARPALISLGAAGRAPVFQAGALADIANLIDQAWQAFGRQLELAATPAAPAMATAGDEEIAAANLATAPTTLPPVERPRNLSLF